MSVDWSQFRDGDRVRVVFEGVKDGSDFVSGDREDFDSTWFGLGAKCVTENATSAELIERPFTPPPAGTLFRNESLFISTGDGFRCVRLPDGKAYTGPIYSTKWSGMAPEWLAGIEVLDV